MTSDTNAVISTNSNIKTGVYTVLGKHCHLFEFNELLFELQHFD